MVRSSHRPIYWFWASQAEFVNELSVVLGHPSIPVEFFEEVRRVISRYVSGLGRRSKDFKALVGFPDKAMFELRFTFGYEDRTRPVRLIFSEQPVGVFFLIWHVKDSTADPALQREMMNNAVKQALARLDQMLIDVGEKHE